MSLSNYSAFVILLRTTRRTKALLARANGPGRARPSPREGAFAPTQARALPSCCAMLRCAVRHAFAPNQTRARASGWRATCDRILLALVSRPGLPSVCARRYTPIYAVRISFTTLEPMPNDMRSPPEAAHLPPFYRRDTRPKKAETPGLPSSSAHLSLWWQSSPTSTSAAKPPTTRIPRSSCPPRTVEPEYHGRHQCGRHRHRQKWCARDCSRSGSIHGCSAFVSGTPGEPGLPIKLASCSFLASTHVGIVARGCNVIS